MKRQTENDKAVFATKNYQLETVVQELIA